MNKTTTELLSIFTVLICGFRFLFDGVSTTLFGVKFELGHIDSLSYGAFLTPILAAHSYIQTRSRIKKGVKPDVQV